MRVIHIIGGGSERGASIGALSLHRALLDSGVDSSVLIQRSPPITAVNSLSSSTMGRIRQVLLRRLDKVPLMMYPRRKREHFFSVGWTGNGLHARKEVKEADIVHLHWINGAMMGLRSLRRFKSPVVWTLRDMWPFTGGCHYSLDCRHFERGCGQCPILGSHAQYDISRKMCGVKKNLMRPGIQPVAISDWLRLQAESSSVFSGRSIPVIHNGIDLTRFYPVDPVQARRQLGLNENKTLILLGSQFVLEPYKGFSVFLEALKLLDPGKYSVMIFGNVDPARLPTNGHEFHMLGFLQTGEELRLAYSAADVTVTPSLQEAFGKVSIESMACSTPVVAFATGGALDIVTHKQNGYLAEPYVPEHLARGITWVTNPTRKPMLSTDALHAVRDRFNITKVADTYRQLYNTLLHQPGASPKQF